MAAQRWHLVKAHIRWRRFYFAKGDPQVIKYMLLTYETTYYLEHNRRNKANGWQTITASPDLDVSAFCTVF